MVPLLSVGVITYNHERFIAQCLDGILIQQTTFPFEVIIGEDCSSDGTRAIVKSYEERYPGLIKSICHGANVGGVRNAYQFVFPLLTGKYIAMCEGDDYWTDPLKLQKQVAFLEQHPELSFCFHPVDFIDVDGNLLDRQPTRDAVTCYTAGEVFHLKIPTLSVVFRNCIRQVPPEMFVVKSCDTLLFGMLACHGGAAELGFHGGCYRKHAGGVYTGMPVVEQYLQALSTLKIMKRSPLFNEVQKGEISQEINIRKKRYMKRFLKRNEMLNSLKVAFS